VAFYWYIAWRFVTYRQAVALRKLTLGFLKSVLSWPTPHTRAALSKNLKSRLAPLFPALTSCQTLIPNSKSLFSCPNHSHSHCCHTIARRSYPISHKPLFTSSPAYSCIPLTQAFHSSKLSCVFLLVSRVYVFCTKKSLTH